MSLQFKVIGVMGRVKNPGVIETLKALLHYLSKLNKEILVDQETASSLNEGTFISVTKQEMSERCHMLIVVGGDGSLLHAARTVVDREIPVLGVNRGRLGFLTDIHPAEFN